MRKSIPKTLKNDVWDKHIGKKNGIGKCFCCENSIDSKKIGRAHV